MTNPGGLRWTRKEFYVRPGEVKFSHPYNVEKRSEHNLINKTGSKVIARKEFRNLIYADQQNFFIESGGQKPVTLTHKAFSGSHSTEKTHVKVKFAAVADSATGAEALAAKKDGSLDWRLVNLPLRYVDAGSAPTPTVAEAIPEEKTT